MLRRIILRNVDTGEEQTMPVTPPGYDVETGRRVETLDMSATGQVNLPGLETLFNKTQEFLLPASPRPYAPDWAPPSEIAERLRRWSLDGNVVRYIVYPTTVNVPVLIETVRTYEQDGTEDLYLVLTLRKYRYLEAPETVTQAADGAARPEEAAPGDQEQSYQVQPGDSLWSICLAHYGDGELCYRLATYNGIANIYLIQSGDVLTLPSRDALEATAPTYPPSAGGQELVEDVMTEDLDVAAIADAVEAQAQVMVERWNALSSQLKATLMQLMDSTDPHYSFVPAFSHSSGKISPSYSHSSGSF